MTPNEARQVLNDEDYAAWRERRDVLGRVARSEIAAAALTMAKHETHRARRAWARKDNPNGRRKFRATLADATSYRRLYKEVIA
jgi:hypothetical protein